MRLNPFPVSQGPFFRAFTHLHELPGPSWKYLCFTQLGPILLYVYVSCMTARLRRILAKLLTTIILGRYMRKLFLRGDWLLAFYSYTLRYLIYIKSITFLYFEKKVLKRAFFKKKNKSENSLHDTGIHGLRHNLEDWKTTNIVVLVLQHLSLFLSANTKKHCNSTWKNNNCWI